VNRADFQELADVRIAEAKVLLDQGMYNGAYYLAGYAVECALKACIAKRTNQYDFPLKKASDYYTHEIAPLVTYAGLADDRKDATDVNNDQRTNWSVVLKWTEKSRYGRNTESDARDLYNAITDPAHGVVPWIKVRW
jgi:HEPN domain-containing protein